MSILKEVVNILSKSSNTTNFPHVVCGSMGVTGYSGHFSGITISTGSTVYTTTHISNSCEYSVLGTNIKVPGYYNNMTALCISIINMLGIESYIEMSKNKLDSSFPMEIKEFLDIQVISHNRNKSIDKIVETSKYVSSESPTPHMKKYV